MKNLETSKQISDEILSLLNRISDLKKQLSEVQKRERKEAREARLRKLETLATKAGILELSEAEMEHAFNLILSSRGGQ